MKVSPTALQLPKEELAQSIPNGTSISDSKYPKRHTNKVVKDLNKEDIKENPIIPCDEDEEAKVPRGGLLHIPAEEVKVPREGLSFAKSKSLEGDSNKVVKDLNKEDIKNNLIIPRGKRGIYQDAIALHFLLSKNKPHKRLNWSGNTFALPDVVCAFLAAIRCAEMATALMI
ncbi:hypothetical protein ACND7T_000643 [Escherichia coli]|nr:hypothetical protein [Escherichia coli]EIW2774283.1 hypothetical protein [Escherichia coli]HBA7955010.1 hypothetical protein [Escherichia coli]HBA7977700.1 hypothetical protein [Escherichia coli]HBA7985476.1 hypothetical protein [Escherichia coli]